MNKPLNLDYVASQCAQKIVDNADKDAKTLDILATKTLEVLQEQGVYAMVLFLLSRSKKEEIKISKIIRSSLYRVLEKVPDLDKNIPETDQNPNETLKFYSEITENLERLLLVRALYEKTLIYTRFGAKAAKKG
ncbi:MAG: hypothetical protein WBA22_01575 [Candidatus Methanofastidiosia archaeon]